MKNNYYVQRDSVSGETIFIEFENMHGYNVLPKTKKDEEIRVNKIVFINPSFSEKIIKRKINSKINSLLKLLEKIENEDDDEGTEDGIRQGLVEAQRLKLSIINNYIKFLGSEYRGLSLKKLEIIIKKLRMKLYLMKEKNNILDYEFERFLNQEPQEERKGRGR